MRVAVAGGSGVVGRHVVSALAEAGHQPVVLARSAGVDLTTGRGLAAALDGVQAVVDVSNVSTTRRQVSVRFFTQVTEQLLTAGARAGVGHHVVLSIVGIDRVGGGYYAGKLRQEELALAGPLPVTVLRATQFHEFAGQLLARTGRGPVAVVPRMPVQPVAAREVADELVRLVLGPPAGRAPDLAGPERHELVDLVRRVVMARGGRQRVVPVRLPGAWRGLRDGALLPGPGSRLARQTFTEWLAGS